MSATIKSRADAIEDLLPQTQCRQCGYDGCRPYAEAIARGDAPINQCPPGGEKGIARLAQHLGQAIIPLNSAHGVEKPRAVAVIDEAVCIGCTLCIQACPVDAILGTNKQMHTVLTDLCTGCQLCVAPCPVDCIQMQAITEPDVTGWNAWSQEQANAARSRYYARKERWLRAEKERNHRLAAKAKIGKL